MKTEKELTAEERVRQRLNYHFKKTDGGWIIPKDMPFMAEFLNEVESLLTKQEEHHQPIERLDAEEYFKKALSENAEAQIDQALANTYIADTQVVELMIGFHAQASKADNDLIKDLKSAIEMGRQIVGARDTEIQSLKKANAELVEAGKHLCKLNAFDQEGLQVTPQEFYEAFNDLSELLSKHDKS